MPRFSMLCLLGVGLVLASATPGRKRKEETSFKHLTSSSARVHKLSATPTFDIKETTNHINNRHKRATGIPLPPNLDATKTLEDPRPCTLHSIRYGCICRYGDKRCDFWENEVLLHSKNYDYFL